MLTRILYIFIQHTWIWMLQFLISNFLHNNNKVYNTHFVITLCEQIFVKTEHNKALSSKRDIQWFWFAFWLHWSRLVSEPASACAGQNKGWEGEGRETAKRWYHYSHYPAPCCYPWWQSCYSRFSFLERVASCKHCGSICCSLKPINWLNSSACTEQLFTKL